MEEYNDIVLKSGFVTLYSSGIVELVNTRSQPIEIKSFIYSYKPYADNFVSKMTPVKMVPNNGNTTT